MNASSNAGKGNAGDRKPNRSIVVPPEFRPRVILEDITRRCTFWTEETGCKVVARFTGYPDRVLVRFDIYGASANLPRAEREVNKWMQSAKTKTPASLSWAKTPAFNENDWYYGEIEALEAQRKEMFKGPVPENAELYELIVPWLPDLLQYNITPITAFGNKLEALDIICTEEEAWILLLIDRQPPFQVSIRAFDVAHAEVAEARYLNLMEKVRAKMQYGSGVLNVILDESEGDQVIFRRADDWWPNGTNGMVTPRLQLLSSTRSVPGGFRNETLHPDQLARVQNNISQALEAIRFDRGSYEFTIRLGCLAVKGSGLEKCQPGTEWPLTGFQKLIDSGTRLECDVRRWFCNDDDGRQLLARLMAADDLLEPCRLDVYYGYLPSTLKETRPIFRGSWIVKDPNTPMQPGKPNENSKPHVPGMIVVNVEWHEDDGIYEKIPIRYYKLKPSTIKPKENMDVNLLELSEGKAWHFGLESMLSTPSSTISPLIVDFAKRVKMREDYGKRPEKDKGGFARWQESPSIKVYAARLEKVFQFGVKNSGYRVEASTMWYPKAEQPCWGLTVRHRDWQEHLAPLEKLAQGFGADFGVDTIKTFIPDNGVSATSTAYETSDGGLQGIRLLIGRLMELSTIVNPTLPGNRGPHLGANLVIRNQLLIDI